MLFSEAMPIFLRYQFEGVRRKLESKGASDAELIEKHVLPAFGVSLMREAWGDDPGETLDDYRLVFWFDN